MRKILTLVFMAALLSSTPARATFSIVAVDTVTGAVGGAGASCIAGAQILNDIIEGVGGVHTQALWLAQNQANAHTLLAAEYRPIPSLAGSGTMTPRGIRACGNMVWRFWPAQTELPLSPEI